MCFEDSYEYDQINEVNILVHLLVFNTYDTERGI